MRTIKFKAKRVDRSEWVFGFYVEAPNNDHRIYWRPFPEATSNTYHEVIPETVCQFTGLLDKNGVEIYEGDEVKCPYGEGIVVSNVGCFMVEWVDDPECLMEFVFSKDGYRPRADNEVFEVTGNIHDK